LPENVDIDGDNNPDWSVNLAGSLTLTINPLDIHYAWLDTITNAFSVVGGAALLTIDRDLDGTPDYIQTCTTFSSSGPVDVTTYHDPDTGQITITPYPP
jgi:hypothetical protein